MSICHFLGKERCCFGCIVRVELRANFLLKEKNTMNILDKIEAEQLKKDVTTFGVGDAVKVHTRVIEGDKERIQIYAGIVIGRKGTGINANFTVRRVSYSEGTERVFPLHSPRIAKIEVEKKGSVRRARLNYLRNRKGKSATTVKEKANVAASAK